MRIKNILYALPAAILMTGCVYDDLSDCPPPSGVRLQLNYRYEVEVPQESPLNRVDLYLFDSENRFAYALTDTQGPFTMNRIYRIALEPGVYTAVAWGNHQSPLTITPATFIKGITTLQEVRMTFASLSSPTSRNGDNPIALQGPSQDLYHNIVKEIQVLPNENTTATLSMTRCTKRINLHVLYKLPDGTPCDDTNHSNNPTIRSNDGILNFENSILPCPWFYYLPTSRNDISGGYDALFSKMRLLLNETSEIILAKPGATTNEDIIYRGELMKWLRGTGYDTQEKIDQTHQYNIRLEFICDVDGTNTTVSIYVNGWKYVEMDDEV